MTELKYRALPDDLQDRIDAAVFRRLLMTLNKKQVDNKELMALAGFCRNCLSHWYQEEAEVRGLEFELEDAQARIYHSEPGSTTEGDK